ncbi:BamA/TamA family outer membrane protein [Baaleninema sp.]|uniref:BamA/TamA family outer membrane protein n=1 Tax=Baaleninema sp. TaxID=3101197 RepID=UPI003CFDD07F
MKSRPLSPPIWGYLAVALGTALTSPVEAKEAKSIEPDVKPASNIQRTLTTKQLESVFEQQGANPGDLRRADALNLSTPESEPNPEESLAEAETESEAVAQSGDETRRGRTTGGLFFEFNEPSIIQSFKGPIPNQSPIVYDTELLESIDYGLLLGSSDVGISNAPGVYGGLQLGYRTAGGRSLVLSGQGGEYIAGGALTYTQAALVGDEYRVGYRLRGGFTNTRDNAFLSDEDDDDVREVYLPIGDEHEPWVNRLGFEGQVFIPISSDGDTVLMPGISYQKIRIQNRAFTDNLYAVDEEGNRLSVSDNGKDDLLLLSLFAQQDNTTRDEYGFPIRGNLFQFGTEQSVSIGDSSVDFNRLSGAYIQYISLNDDAPHTLILGLQGGAIIGDVPGYEAFNLGGFDSVRGFTTGDVGTAESFLQGRLEYRFPIFSWEDGLFEKMRGLVAVQYASDLGTGGNVIGEPAEVRDKPGDGFGFSVGLHFLNVDFPIVPIVETVRMTAGVSDRGDFSFYFSLGPTF